jgi:hypothetical protein
MTFDSMKWSAAKIEGVRDSMTEDESFLDYVFPLLRYHSRITELESEDLEYWFSDPELDTDNGYLIKTGVNPRPEQEPITDAPEELLPARAMEYLERIRELCKEHGSELILVKAPTNPRGYWWYDEWEAQIDAYAKEKDLAYYNFIPLVDKIGIDWNTDTYDYGLHLNVDGAEKLTDHFGNILVQEHGLKSHKGESATAARWNAYLSEYESKKKEMENKSK